MAIFEEEVLPRLNFLQLWHCAYKVQSAPTRRCEDVAYRDLLITGQLLREFYTTISSCPWYRLGMSMELYRGFQR